MDTGSHAVGPAGIPLGPGDPARHSGEIAVNPETTITDAALPPSCGQINLW